MDRAKTCPPSNPAEISPFIRLVPNSWLISPRQDILYSSGELTRPCLGNIRLTRTQSYTAHS
jgi:hypothetical protein